MHPSAAQLSIWSIAALATAGVILRPFRLPEAVWAVAGAVALVVAGLLSPLAALHGMGRGLDVYLFLTGMMLLAEVARDTGLFDWLAAQGLFDAPPEPRPPTGPQSKFADLHRLRVERIPE